MHSSVKYKLTTLIKCGFKWTTIMYQIKVEMTKD